MSGEQQLSAELAGAAELRARDLTLTYSRGDVAEIEGRLAVYFIGHRATARGRWEWLDSTWTSIPLSVGPVLFNIYDQAKETLNA